MLTGTAFVVIAVILIGLRIFFAVTRVKRAVNRRQARKAAQQGGYYPVAGGYQPGPHPQGPYSGPGGGYVQSGPGGGPQSGPFPGASGYPQDGVPPGSFPPPANP
jgi:hypothetical protein